MKRVIAILREIAKTVRVLFIIFLVIAVIATLIFLFAYYNAAKDLPPLNSEFDIERNLRTTIEGERGHLRGEAGRIHEDVRWPRPSLADVPHDYLVMYLYQFHCPTFLQTARESQLAWSWRVFRAQVLEWDTPGRDGRCELHFAAEIATHMRIPPGGPQAIAAHRLRSLVSKDQLVAYDLAAVPLEQGYFGLPDAAKLLLHRPLAQLTLAEQAELSIAMPPQSMYDEVRDCQRPLVIKTVRDQLLQALGKVGAVPLERALAAQGKPLSCDRFEPELR